MNVKVRSMLFCLCLPLAAMRFGAEASPAVDRIERLTQLREASKRERAVALPAGAEAVRNVVYGADPAQRFDVYLPKGVRRAPVFFFVHGGGWANGDKTNPGIENKIGFWLAKGYAVISANYRMLPEAAPLLQARDVAQAVATAQRRAGEWNLDPARFVLAGHSAGAHLVALLGAEPKRLADAGAQRPLGVVSLDSGALDVPALMGMPRLPKLYRNAFGADESYWVSTSPQQQLGRTALPMLIVCSSERRFPSSPCDEGRKLARKAAQLGVRMEVLPEPMSHAEINRELGLPSAYTEAVAKFVDSLVI
ncbi:alpha/beta hydrolase [Pseudoxanthomonas sp. CF125]|uniref:alpha/beta hydrolase n=1 Tax=Pseudoxanthomonas sp. CF125 TaxID=1855303 RepID=UPI000886E2E7|nr:alpha/beta hydrolase [Pseudoxanthomonas sp. CF125]SDR12610.1 Acetyl esterase/lipase [Pseudoxanthomonas sp. CF125]